MVQNEPQFELTFSIEEEKYGQGTIYILCRGGYKCTCANAKQNCSSRCPFFMIDLLRKSVSLKCQSTSLTILFGDS